MIVSPLGGHARCTCHNPLYCFVPPHVLDNLLKSKNAKVRDAAVKTVRQAAAARERRLTLAMMPMLAATPSPAGKKYRLIYDMQNEEDPLPGKLLRSEGQKKAGDAAANEAYDYSGTTYDFYQSVFKRNSLDDNGMMLISSVHLGAEINNAFWNGEQMLYGDGDGVGFIRFTRALDVVAHELTHGVTSFTSNLVYRNESGALNESFSDVMSALVLQWSQKQSVAQATWRMGEAIMGPATKAKGLRTFKPGKAYENDPIFGTDPQPKHIKDKYTGTGDYGGVHINSGIPNCAFYHVAMELGGNAWGDAGWVWYQTLRGLTAQSDFQACADMTYRFAADRGTSVMKAVAQGWKQVGLTVREPAAVAAVGGLSGMLAAALVGAAGTGSGNGNARAPRAKRSSSRHGGQSLERRRVTGRTR